MTDEARANQCADSVPGMQEPKLAPVLGFPLGYLHVTLALSSVPVPGIYPPLPSYDSACHGGAELTMTQVYSTPQVKLFFCFVSYLGKIWERKILEYLPTYKSVDIVCFRSYFLKAMDFITFLA